MNQTTLRIGMISFAHGHANSYAACLQQIDNVEIAGIYDAHWPRAQEKARQLGVPSFDTIDALLEQGLDAVIICSENAKHREHVEQVAGQTGAILCEKPIATTIEDAQVMIDICAATDTHLQIAFPVRFSPPIQQLKEILDREELGCPYAAKCTNHGSMPGGWFVDQALSGGGAVIDHTVHVIDLLRWFWNTEVTEVYAEIGNSLLHPNLGIDDVGILSLQLANGVYGTLDTSWSRPKSYLTGGDVKIEVVGTQGAIQVDTTQQHITVSSDAIGKTRWVSWASNMDRGLIQDFVEMLWSDRSPSITGQDGLQALEVALAAYQSAEIGNPVAIQSL